MILYVTRTFSAAHHLPNYNGPCECVHGHTWKVEVWIEGEIQPDGMVVDFKRVKDVIDYFDHGDLNDYIANPTAENLVEWFFNELQLNIPIPTVIKVRVWESKDCYAEVSG